MDPFTLALATFGVQKLRGKSTRMALKDAALVGGTTYGIGQLSPSGSVGADMFDKEALSSLRNVPGADKLPSLTDIKGQKGNKEVYDALIKQATKTEGGIKSLEAQDLLKQAKEFKPSGFEGLSTKGKVLTGAAVASPFLMDEGKPNDPPFTEEDYQKAYADQQAKLKGSFDPVEVNLPQLEQVYGQDMFYANSGGLAEIVKKYNKGGINYLPSKTDHNENDVNNYVRAEGYVEDGAGNGDKDEDTMLAQLADGEFVSRADAVLGAGILSGGDPKSYKSMRKAGADFFYDQQKKLKRIYDLVDASRKDN